MCQFLNTRYKSNHFPKKNIKVIKIFIYYVVNMVPITFTLFIYIYILNKVYTRFCIFLQNIKRGRESLSIH